MARPTQYNLEKVLDNAMDIFWKKICRENKYFEK